MKYQDDLEQLAGEYIAEGRQALFENKLSEAAILLQNGIRLLKKTENYERYAFALNVMGVVYAVSGNEMMAMEYYLEGLECAAAHHCESVAGYFYNNIGSRYQELNEHGTAIEYFRKALVALEHPSSREAEYYESLYLSVALNMMVSYRELGEYVLAEKYLKTAELLMQKEELDKYKYTFLISKCKLYWNMGRSDYVRGQLEELTKSGVNDDNALDYQQDMCELCSLLKDMKEYDHWKSIILAFERYANEQNSVSIQMIRTEMWADYCYTIGEQEKYVSLCVEYMELCRKQKEIIERERAAAIDLKIELWEKEAARKQAEEKSTTDALTGLGNRYLLEQEAVRIAGAACAVRRKITVGVLDIDCFKQHNDTYGHIRGDDCLKMVADILKEAVDGEGYAYRFGGDEFVVLLQNGDAVRVEEIAQQVKRKLEEAKLENINSSAIPEITVSQGYACFVPTGTEHWDGLVEHADTALYHVKNHGRNGYHIILE